MTEWIPYARLRPESEVVGDLRIAPEVDSPELGNRRQLLALLPPSYGSSERSYPVVYMHDGQNLFDPQASYAGAWRVDQVMQRLAASGLEAVVVGIPNAREERYDEYCPWISDTESESGRGGRGEAYHRFLLHTVKPLIESAFRVSRDARATGLLGSSMGAVISLYSLLRRRDVFGFAGLMSPAIWFARREILAFVDRAPAFLAGRLYLDVGTDEHPDDPKMNAAYLDGARSLRRRLEPRYGERLLYAEDEGGRHHEPAWGRRLDGALRFLLEPYRSGA